jgi:hypothetical protein
LKLAYANSLRAFAEKIGSQLCERHRDDLQIVDRDAEHACRSKFAHCLKIVCDGCKTPRRCDVLLRAHVVSGQRFLVLR